MGIIKFISKVTQLLELKDFEEKKSDKKSIKLLIKKLEQRQHKLHKKLKKDIIKDDREDIAEELEIIEIQMHKGKKILKELKSS
ncbi:MAG: hypothetical protein U9N49_06620 [Campylobacterota bacterium]|nr:hypothetical protein [Campylobacterota bacterium]